MREKPDWRKSLTTASSHRNSGAVQRVARRRT
jgi:hypothetical protein